MAPGNRFSRRLRVFVASTSAVVVLAAVAAAAFTVSGALDSDAVRAAVTGAIHTQQEVSLPPPTYDGGRMPETTKALITDQGTQNLEDYFAGPELAARVGVLQANVDEQADGDTRYLGAGVTGIKITDIEVTGDQATVVASADVWAEFAQVQADGKAVTAKPTNTMNYTMTLSRIDGRWYVVRQRMSFAPGSEP